MRPRGGYIGFNRVPAAAAFNSAASGVWTLREAESLKRAGTWPSAPTVPGTPTALSAAGGNAQASLTWTAPTDTGGISIADYSVQFSSDSGSTWTTFSRTASATASQTVTGLTNGTAYVFRVAAINGAGTGAYTAASSSVTPTAAPTVTGGTITTPGDGYKYHTFTSSGTLAISGGSLTCDVLVVGGGGGGGRAGGGGGGVLHQQNQSIAQGSYAITVAGQVNGSTNNTSSSIGALFVATGGLGGAYNWVTGATSGYPTSTSANTGNAGGQASLSCNSPYDGYLGGGGGGAGGVGGNAFPTCVSGSGGGPGIAVWGTTYGAGGGGVDQDLGTNAPANVGRGGTGTQSKGGSGIVIVRYLSA